MLGRRLDTPTKTKFWKKLLGHLLFSLDLAITLLLVLSVDELLLKSSLFVSLLLQPRLLLLNQLFLSFLEVLLVLDLLLDSKFFAQGMGLGVFALLHESFEDLFVLQQLGRLLEAERLVQVALIVFS